MQRLMNAWADGLNYFLATHPEVKPRVINAVRAVDGAELHRRQHRRRHRADRPRRSSRHSIRASSAIAAALSALTIEPAGLQRHRHRAGADRATASALLLINPHTSFFFRSEQQVTSDEGLNVYGAATWGQFFIYQGFNPHAGWMHTSSGVDNVDEFAETVERRGNGFCYRYGNECRPLGIAPDHDPLSHRRRAARLRAASPPIAPITARSSGPKAGGGSPSR